MRAQPTSPRRSIQAGVLALLILWLGSSLAKAGEPEPTQPQAVITASAEFSPAPNPTRTQHLPLESPRRIQPAYSIEVGLDGEIFPVFANYAALQPREKRTWGMIAVTVHNSGESALRNRVMVQVPGWSDQEVQFAEVPAQQDQTLLFAPAFLPRLFQNHEIAAATVMVRISEATGRNLFEETVPVRLRSVDDMYWGERFKFAPYIASWVTPHDPLVEAVLRRAKEFAPKRRLPGYEEWKDQNGQQQETEVQARAIYRAVQAVGVSYVKSSLTFGQNTSVSERIRMPRESLRDSSANCIDGVVMYAALFENLGMDAAVVLVPGHAYVGVRQARGLGDYLYFDTALTGRADFDAAVRAAERGLAHTSQSQITTIRISDARLAGIFPLPGQEAAVSTPSTNAALRAEKSAAQTAAQGLPGRPDSRPIETTTELAR